MERILIPLLRLLAHPKKVIQIDESKLEYLDGKTAHILFAVAEAVIGEDFRLKAPNFISVIDDYLGYQRQAQREALTQALLLIEARLVNLLFSGHLRGFSHLSLAERQSVLAKLKASDRQLLRNLYAAFVGISASTFYANEATWKEINYDGVSIDHQEILAVPRWRPNDSRPVEP